MSKYFTHDEAGKLVVVDDSPVSLDQLNQELADMEQELTRLVGQRRQLIELIDQYPTDTETEYGGAGEMLPVELNVTPGDPNA